MSLENSLKDAINAGECVAYVGDTAKEFILNFYREVLHSPTMVYVASDESQIAGAISANKFPLILTHEARAQNQKLNYVAFIHEGRLLGLCHKLTHKGGL